MSEMTLNSLISVTNGVAEKMLSKQLVACVRANERTIRCHYYKQLTTFTLQQVF